MIVRIAVRGPIMIIFSLIMAFGINHKLSLVFLLAIPVLGGGLYFIMTHAHPIFDAENLSIFENEKFCTL